MTKLGIIMTQNAVWGLEKFGLVPKGTYDVGESLKGAAAALVAGGKQRLFTSVAPLSASNRADLSSSPMALWVLRKASLSSYIQGHADKQ